MKFKIIFFVIINTNNYNLSKMQNLIESNKDKLIEYCKLLKVKSMYLFGSAVNENFNEDSDIDFLISFPKNLSIDEYTNNYFALHYKLRDLFGREVDIVTESTLSNPYFIETVNETKELIYES